MARTDQFGKAMSGREPSPRITAVVSDVDGTLVRGDKSLSDRTVAAIAGLRSAGIAFAIVSSRPPRGLKALIERLGITTFVAGFNGGVIARPDLSIVASHLIAPDVASETIEAIEKAGADAWVFSGQAWCVRDPDGAHVDLEKRTVGFDPTIVSDFSGLTHAAAKIVAVSDDRVLLARLQNDLNDALGIRANAIRSQTYYLDITSPRANKGDALHELARLMNVPPAHIAVLGDGENDVPLFAQAGLSIAMGNAEPDVMRAADFVTTTNDADGVAAALDWFVLGGRRVAMPQGAMAS
jgi:Cof subfamily protein (haloacid dehalogenase superfamily)